MNKLAIITFEDQLIRWLDLQHLSGARHCGIDQKRAECRRVYNQRCKKNERKTKSAGQVDKEIDALVWSKIFLPAGKSPDQIWR